MSPNHKFVCSNAALVILLLLFSVTEAFTFVDRIRQDFLALTRRSTTRHILLPRGAGFDAALLLKQKIRNKVTQDNMFIVDAFSAAADRYSVDKDTSSRGGLLGDMAPQGYCLCEELDRASFLCPLGEVSGPIESKYGYHLVLVCERTNCQKLDGDNVRVVRGEDGYTSMLSPPNDGEVKSTERVVAEFSIGQIGFWIGASLAGGVVAEIAAKAAGVLETLPFEHQIPII